MNQRELKPYLALAVSVCLPILVGGLFFQAVDAAGKQNNPVANSRYALEIAAAGTTITVTTETDELNSDGDCSLREALEAANTDAAVDACPMGSGWDTINLPAGNYKMAIIGSAEDANATGDLDVLDSVTIIGAGADTTTLNGDGVDRLLHVDPDIHGGVTLDLSGVTITNGSSDMGGGLRANSGLTIIQDSVFLQNQATTSGGGIQVDFGTTRVLSTTVEDNSTSGTGKGGGIYVDRAAVTLNNSTIFNNTADEGGGMYANAGSVSVQATKVYTNTTIGLNGSGGGIYSYASNVILEDGSEISYNQAAHYGGGIYSYSYARLSISDSWLHHNSTSDDSGGGVYLAGEGTTVHNSTIEHNTADNTGGGFYAEGDLIIQSSTLAHNHAGDTSSGGGAIYQNEGTLVISDTVVFSNTTSGNGGGVFLYTSGGVYVRNSIFNENLAVDDGGAIYIYVEGGIILKDSTFTNNKAFEGGAIMIFEKSALTIERSTFSGNVATTDGGALYLNDSAPTEIYNSTFSGNHAVGNGGAIYVQEPAPLIEFSTIVSNTAGTSGGGIYSEDYAAPQSSIIAGNSAGGSLTAGDADCLITTKLFSGGDNIFGNGTGCDPSRYDQVVAPTAVSTTVLEPLADNGGAELPDGSHPKTHALRSGSPAVDAGNDTFCPPVDQPGSTRPQGNACDAGAYESSFSASIVPASHHIITVDTTDDELIDDGDCSLREALQAANTDTAVDECTAGNGWDTISLLSDTYTLSLAGFDEDSNVSGDLDILDAVTIRGNNASTTSIDGDYIDRVLDVFVSTLFLDGVTVTKGSTVTPTDDKGGCIRNVNGLLILLDSVVSYCLSDNYGAGIFNTGAVFQMSNSTVTENVSSSENGGVYIDDGVATIQNSTIISNTGASNGGGVMSYVAATRISDSEVFSNTITTSAGGGGIYHDYGNLIINEGTEIRYNISASDGGGVHAEDGAIVIEDSTISHNQTGTKGGGIYADDGMWMHNTTVEYNQATGDGGGIYGSGYVQDSTIQHNQSASDGGGMYTWGIIEGSLIQDNKAPAGGGIYAVGVAINNSTVSDNQALNYEGGGLYLTGSANYGSAMIVNSTIRDNIGASGEEGGGVYAELVHLILRGSTFSGNSGADLGGAIYSSQGVVDLLNSTISGNSAEAGSGLYILDILSLNFSTVADNSASTSAGGIYNAYVTTIENSIVAGNEAASSTTDSAADCQEVNPITYGGYSLFGSGTGCSADGINDQTVTPADVFTTVLGSLANNGGGTNTHALLPGSSALDTLPGGTNGCSTTIDTDQRGVARPQGGSCDSGSFEAETQLLSINIEGTGSGSVSSSPAGVNCSTDCSIPLGYGKTFTMTATADPGSIFIGWGGDCSGKGDCVVTMTEARAVRATFDETAVYLPLVVR